tara:strand:+ start:935 stop:4804 length:3870 start_codon:yes stop_codon:yes gene_type:complete
MSIPLEASEKNLLPSIYFKKIILESGDSTAASTGNLVVTLDLEINFEFDTSVNSQFVLNNDLLQFAHIKIVRLVRAKEDRGSFNFSLGTEITPDALEGWMSDTPATAVQVRDSSLSELISGDITAYPASVTARGTTLIKVPLNGGASRGIVDDIGASDIPSSLAYYAYCYYDMEEIGDAYNITLDDPDTNYSGVVTGEEVLANSETVKTANVYIIAAVTDTDANTSDGSTRIGVTASFDGYLINIPKPVAGVPIIGQVWTGPRKCVEMGGTPDEPICTKFATNTSVPGYDSLLLEKISIPNTRISDNRTFDVILGADLFLGPATNIIDDILGSLPCKGTGTPAGIVNSIDWFDDASPYLAEKTKDVYGFSCTPDRRIKMNAPEIYFSEAYLSRDQDGNCRFLFQLDYDRIIRDKSLFGSLYNDYQTNINKNKIKSLSPILNLRIVRRQVDPHNSYNRLGTPIVGRVRDEFHNATEFLVESRDERTTQALKGDNNGKGEIKEISGIHTSDDAGDLLSAGIRTFTVSDFSLHGVSGETRTQAEIDLLTHYDRAESNEIHMVPGTPTGDGTIPPDRPETYEERQARLESEQSHYDRGVYMHAADPPAGPSPIYYQYGIELEVEDGTIPFLNYLLDSTDESTLGLKKIRTRFMDYYSKLEQFERSKRYYNVDALVSATELGLYGTSKKGNYLYKIAGPQNSRTLPWNITGDLAWIVVAITTSQRAQMEHIVEAAGTGHAVSISSPSILAAANGIEQLKIGTLQDNFDTFLNPETTTSENVNSMIVLVDRLIAAVEAALGNYLTPTTENLTFTPSSTNQSYKRGIMTLNKYFYDVFDSNSPPNTHLDFLGEGTYGSLFNMNMRSWEKRANSEVKMYFKSDKQEVINGKGFVEVPYDDPAFNNILNVKSTKNKVWSAAKISVGTNQDVKRVDSGLTMMDIKGPRMDKYTSISAQAIALNMKDFNPMGASLTQNGIAATKHLLVKLGIQVVPKAVPKVLILDVINLTDTRYIPVAQILGDDDFLVKEDLVGLTLDKSAFGIDYATAMRSYEKDFDDAIPILKGIVGNVARNGAFVQPDPSGRISNPHKMVAPPLNKKMFDVNSAESLFEKSRKSPMSGDAGLWGAAFQSLVAAGTNSTIWDPLSFTNTSFPSGGGTVEVEANDDGDGPDYFEGPDQALMTWNYEILADIEILTGFEKDGSGRRVLNWPKWESPDEYRWAQILTWFKDEPNEQAFILCRVSLKEDAELGLVPPPGVVLPIINEYFTLTKENLIGAFAVEAHEGGGGEISPGGGGVPS